MPLLTVAATAVHPDSGGNWMEAYASDGTLLGTVYFDGDARPGSTTTSTKSISDARGITKIALVPSSGDYVTFQGITATPLRGPAGSRRPVGPGAAYRMGGRGAAPGSTAPRPHAHVVSGRHGEAKRLGTTFGPTGDPLAAGTCVVVYWPRLSFSPRRGPGWRNTSPPSGGDTIVDLTLAPRSPPRPGLALREPSARPATATCTSAGKRGMSTVPTCDRKKISTPRAGLSMGR